MSAGISRSAGAYVQDTGGKRESATVIGANPEVSATEVSAKQGGRQMFAVCNLFLFEFG